MLSVVEHEKSFATLGPGIPYQLHHLQEVIDGIISLISSVVKLYCNKKTTLFGILPCIFVLASI